MLQELHLRGIGPVEQLDMVLGERLNVLTGDNGLGKTFLLDVCWWALTATWAGPAIGARHGAAQAEAVWRETTRQNHHSVRFTAGGPANAPLRHLDVSDLLVVYVRVDGSFAVYDPYRNGAVLDWSEQTHLPAYRFSPDELWQGLPLDEPRKLCNGLIADWVLWQYSPDQSRHAMLRRLLHHLSEDQTSLIEPGAEPTKLSPSDVRPVPTLDTPYGTVPITHASAAVRRILGLAYVLAWTWTEHQDWCSRRGNPLCRRLVFLLDEVECHLHPFWQRKLLPSLLEVAKLLCDDLEVQLIVTTHAPLVLASLEPHFDEARDKLWTFELEQDQVSFRELPWVRQGEAANWLTSDVFDLASSRSIEAEQAVLCASALMRGEPVAPLTTLDDVQAALERTLAQHDRFWPRWVGFLERIGRDPR